MTTRQDPMKESERWLRLFVDQAPAALAMFDREMRYLLASRRWIKDYGLEGRDLQGLCHYDVFPEIPERWREAHRRGLAGEVVTAEEDSFVRAGGSVQWVRWEVHPWRDSDGNVAGIVMFTEDITYRKQAEEELRQAKEELELRVQERTEELRKTLRELKAETDERIQAVEEVRRKEQLLIEQNRFAAMGEMIANIAHQWRQPLNTLALIIQGLDYNYSRGNFSADYLHSSKEEAMRVIQHMSRTIDDFRNFFSTDRSRQLFCVNAVVASTVSLLAATFKNQDIEIETREEDELTVEGYPNEFSHVILNLLLNAKDIFLERATQQPRVEIRIFREHGLPAVTITDNAGGVADGIIGKIFDPYFTTKGPVKGTGIGLFMSKTIVERNMNGRLSVKNTADGAQFKMILNYPSAPAPAVGDADGNGEGKTWPEAAKK